jgi:HAD superfamily hydrolase (TIGR01662 family)
MPLCQFRAVLFDLGETLLDMSGINPDLVEWDRHCFGAAYDYLHELGQSLPPFEAFLPMVSGRLNQRWEEARQTNLAIHVGVILGEILTELGIHLSSVEAAECLRRHYRWCDETAVLYPEVLDTLRYLRAQGLKLGLISNSIWPAECHDPTLARLGVRDLLAVRLYTADAGYQKPHPAIFQEALRRLGVRADEAAFVGDRLTSDVGGAQSVGMKGILRVLPYRVEEDARTQPDACVHSLAELPEALTKLQ